MQILVVEDSVQLRNVIHNTLSIYGYKLDLCDSTEVVNKIYGDNRYKLAIINSKLIKITPKQLIERLKAQYNAIPCLGLVNGNDPESRAYFLNSGGDDVLSYPYSVNELLARVRRLTKKNFSSQEVIYENNFKLDPESLTTEYKGEYLDLRKQEFNIFSYLLKNKGRPVTRSELRENAWEYGKSLDSNTIDVHISKLRKKLGRKVRIQSIHGIGYKVISRANEIKKQIGGNGDYSKREEQILLEEL